MKISISYIHSFGNIHNELRVFIRLLIHDFNMVKKSTLTTPISYDLLSLGFML